ncbi:MAG: hypothetical protein IKY92_09655 [Akkermansia sp.]|nr:hypothetical protein [Akkermansia sp.]
MRITALIMLLLGGGIFHSHAAHGLVTRSRITTTPWWKSMQSAIMEIQRHGPGNYSTEDQAKQALIDAFHWDEAQNRPCFKPLTARPTFCSAAVWAATLAALLHWEDKNHRRAISPEAWKALLPRMVKDGEGPWGYANANGPGFALLVHRLGAGINFTDWEKARPSDVLKIWWNDHIGGRERGHIVILVKDEGDTVCVWSAHIARDGQPAGYGLRRIPKKSMKRVLFTRITNPSAFTRASQLQDEPWLTGLMTHDTTWAECVQRCGIDR